MSQQSIALAIVGIAAFAVLMSFFRKYVARPLAQALLKRGQVKWAMKFKSQVREPGCDSCE